MPVTTDLSPITEFLLCATPEAWIDRAVGELETLLIDHAHCEKKAAGTALNLMFRYPLFSELQHCLSRLAREELRHFEQVLALIEERGMSYRSLSASRYAGQLREHVRPTEPGRLVDTLIVGAIIEARSCERFASLAPRLQDPALAKYYRFLLKSEARHFEEYLRLAQMVDTSPIDEHVQRLLQVDKQLIESRDEEFRFHSGVPI